MAELRIAFLGDIVGRPGRRVVQQQIAALRERYSPHRIIANGENARSGSGISPDIYRKLRADGIDAVTLGDHVYRDQRIRDLLIAPDEPICRPANLSAHAPGKRWIRLDPPPQFTRPILIFTVLGRIFFPLPADDPFACADAILQESGGPLRPIVIVEAHMEATSEKIALATHLSGRVAAVLGTHTHVPTADARVLPGGTAFITDLGMSGPYDSVIGRDSDAVLRFMRTGQFTSYPVATGGAKVCGALVRIDDGSGRALSIERIELDADEGQPPFA